MYNRNGIQDFWRACFASKMIHFRGFMGTNAVRTDTPRRALVSVLKYSWRRLSGRSFRTVIECSYDALAWVCGLLAAAWVTRDLAAGTGVLTMIWAVPAICLLSAGSGLLAGLYRSRYERGSLGEVMAVGMSACIMTLFVALVSPALVSSALVSGQRAALLTVAGGAVFAAPAMLGGRYT